MTDSDNSFVHGGPRVAGLQAAGQFIALPDVTNTWHRFSADAQHYFTQKVGVGLGLLLREARYRRLLGDRHERSGWICARHREPRIDWLGVLLTGYGPRPYSGSTGFVRLLFKF